MGRSESTARVPALVGLALADAHDAALDAGVIAVDDHPGAPAVRTATVTRQRPRAGRHVAVGTRVQIWTADPGDGHGSDGGGGDNGGGGGDREPLVPRPPVRTGTK
jgi:beta-lactam-binding protein with PASTA domain